MRRPTLGAYTIVKPGRRLRAGEGPPFNSEAGLLLEIVSRGEFMIRGICNKDLQPYSLLTCFGFQRGQMPLVLMFFITKNKESKD